jgi:hypothetical protein
MSAEDLRTLLVFLLPIVADETVIQNSWTASTASSPIATPA